MTADDQSLGRPGLIAPTTPARIVVGQDLAGMLEAFVSRLAPRLFALVEITPERRKDPVVAWGLQFDDQVHVVSCDGQLRGSFSSPDRALWLFSYRGTEVRLVWCTPADRRHHHPPRRRTIRRSR
ncbi:MULTISPECIES: hypothetical protein [Frankia]|uniref:Uncharacterized protein n=2 Tax=Frankia TaxID=1854 RepID=Q0RC50_FRAAA|nr:MULTISPECIES: hypothetical protein [Frankia]CAJ64978.1 hypothetical protein FRAAL6355 [Frankia alni ACN14a]